MRSLGDVLKENRNIGPGFDCLRVGLALSIVGFHSLTVTNSYFTPPSLDDTPFWIVHYGLVPMFFALSGFLVSGSASRLSLGNFLINRGMRIVPALAVDTIVCALIIGPIFTSFSLEKYFFNAQFAVFFMNVFGWVHFTLPGVFTTHAVNEVNGSLWTVPFELFCYLIISVLIIGKFMNTKIVVPVFVIGYLTVCVVIYATNLPELIHFHGVGKAISVVFIEHEAQAVTAFLFGIIIFQNRHRLPYSPLLFVICVGAILLIAIAFPSMEKGQVPLLRFLLMPALAYVTVFLGLTPLPLPKFFKTGDYSYGIYLYHQPFLQIVISLFPALALAPKIGPVFTFFVGLPFILAIAWLSWHFIEKPLLALRKRFSIMAKTRGVDGALPKTDAVPAPALIPAQPNPAPSTN